MLTVPAFVWRGGAVTRSVLVGVSAGVVIGLLAWLDSGLWFPALLAGAIVAVVYGIWLGTRMVTFWPGASALTGEQRVRVAGVTRWAAASATPPWRSRWWTTPTACASPPRPGGHSGGCCPDPRGRDRNCRVGRGIRLDP